MLTLWPKAKFLWDDRRECRRLGINQGLLMFVTNVGGIVFFAFEEKTGVRLICGWILSTFKMLFSKRCELRCNSASKICRRVGVCP